MRFPHLLLIVLSVGFVLPSYALDPEPRQWNHIPIGINFTGGGYAYTKADIFFDPVLQLEDVKMTMDTWAAKYVHAFELMGKTARIDVTQGFHKARWKGLQDGVRASTARTGWSDTFVRFGINLYGAPPKKGKEFLAYRQSRKVETIVGAALRVRLPTGDYQKEKLLNLGQNRYVFVPQLGLLHKRGKWTTELTGEIIFHTKNDEFFDGNTRKQDPFYFVHAHLIRSFGPGQWLGAGVGYEYGGESTINGVDKDDRKRNIGWVVNYSFPISRQAGIKLTYLDTHAQADTGFNSKTWVLSGAFIW